MIKIETILDILKKDQNFREIIADGDYYFNYQGLSFDKISYDSRKADSKTLFFVKGEHFKREFLEKAVAAGLGFYLSETDFEVGIPVLLVNDIKRAMSLIAMEFYGHPEQKLKLLAFTGTKGKTTSAYFAFNILKQSHKPALLSTMNTTLDGETFFKSTLTTPESLDLFGMMAQAVANGRTHLIMEVSSQAYLKKRVYGLTFDVGVFLNISPDHIGPIEHPTFEDYFYHKRLLMDNSRAVIVNSSMDHFQVLAEQVANYDHEVGWCLRYPADWSLQSRKCHRYWPSLPATWSFFGGYSSWYCPDTSARAYGGLDPVKRCQGLRGLCPQWRQSG